jgi:hypothetical protein
VAHAHAYVQHLHEHFRKLAKPAIDAMIQGSRRVTAASDGPPPCRRREPVARGVAAISAPRPVLGGPAILSDARVIDLAADDQGDDLTDTERRALHEALSASGQSVEAGRLRPASAILDELRQRR